MKGQIRVVAGKPGGRAEGSRDSDNRQGWGQITKITGRLTQPSLGRCESIMQRERALVALGLNL